MTSFKKARNSNLKLTLPSDSLSPEVEDRPMSSCGSVKSLKSNINEANEEFEDDPTAELQRLPSLTQTGTVFILVIVFASIVQHCYEVLLAFVVKKSQLAKLLNVC